MANNNAKMWASEKEILGKEIVLDLYKYGMIRTWYRHKKEGWTLHSGLWSPVYINLRNLPSYPGLFRKVGSALASLIKNECGNVSYLVGIATAGVPIASAVAISGSIPMGYTRKVEGVKDIGSFRSKIAEYGQHTLVEGDFKDGETIALVDDLVTRLTSKLIAVEQVRYELENRKINATCNDIIVLLDREQGAKKMAAENGLNLYALIPFRTKGLSWLKKALSGVEYRVIKDYLENPEKYQDKDSRESLLGA
ncbi:MAG: orotate phosphoribosyltransferase [Promethearchaeota archaeon]